MKRDIARLVALDNDTWHAASMKASWHFRTGTHPMPPVILAACAGVQITKEEWADIRKAVNARRKADKSTEARYIRKVELERKRAYQRNYMRAYRAKQRQPDEPA